MNRYAFNFDLNTFNHGDVIISNGKLFHSFGAAQANARSPSVIFVLYDGICSNKVSRELRKLWVCLLGLNFKSSEIQVGV